jgi:amino acid transporter
MKRSRVPAAASLIYLGSSIVVICCSVVLLHRLPSPLNWILMLAGFFMLVVGIIRELSNTGDSGK